MTIEPVLEALEELESRRASGTLRCPDGTEQVLSVELQATVEWMHVETQDGFCDVARGQGQITIRGLSIEDSAITVDDAPIDFAIAPEGRSTLLRGHSRIALDSRSRWEELTIVFGLSADGEFHCDLYFGRLLPAKGAMVNGEDMHCPVSGITLR